VTSIVVISGGLSQPSATKLLADRLAQATLREVGLRGDRSEMVWVELRELAHDITNHLLTGFPAPPLAKAITALRDADAVIAVTPVFSASYSGLFKAFIDILDTDSLDGTPVLIAATGGSARHSLALEYAVRPLMAYLRAAVVPTSVFAATGDFGDDDTAATLADRIDRAAAELADAIAGTTTRKRTDPFAGPLSFEQLLGAQLGDQPSS
jgi:FMN reductase